jgi:hypothetical protein
LLKRQVLLYLIGQKLNGEVVTIFSAEDLAVQVITTLLRIHEDLIIACQAD